MAGHSLPSSPVRTTAGERSPKRPWRPGTDGFRRPGASPTATRLDRTRSKSILTPHMKDESVDEGAVDSISPPAKRAGHPDLANGATHEAGGVDARGVTPIR